MALVNIRDLIYHAYTNRYAVGGFDIVSLDFLSAVITAAESCRSPVILCLSESHFEYGEFEPLMAAAERAAITAGVPVAIQLAHGTSLDDAIRAISLGCNGVTAQTAHQSLPAAIKTTFDITQIAHRCGVAVEGELGHSENPHQTPPTESNFTSAQETIAYAQRTQIDFLAVSVGTAQVDTKSKSRVDIPRLSKINQTLNIPLTIHGNTVLTDEQYYKLISHGVAKINYSVPLTETAAKQINQNCTGKAGKSYGQWMQGVHHAIKGEVTRCMQLWGSAGRAAEVMMQCRPWQNVAHVIVFNTKGGSDEDTMQMINHGQQQLSKIPGVRDVVAGKAIHNDSQFRYSWLIRFCSPEVVEFYKDHPIHKHYADHYFRPRAEERITTDYQIFNHAGASKMDLAS